MKWSLFYKSKNLALWLIKIVIVCAVFVFLYVQLKNKTDELQNFYHYFLNTISLQATAIIVCFSFLNWTLEILKWQNLVSVIQPISFKEAAKQSLSGMTLSVFTPNGIGDYGAKILYFEKAKTQTVLLLNFLANGVQMAFTTLFGLVGLAYFMLQFSVHAGLYWSVGLGLLITFSFFLALYFLRHKDFWGYTLQQFLVETQQISTTIHLKNGIYGLLRFLVFCHQYAYILYLLNVNLPYPEVMATLFVMYLTASVIPNFQIADVALKGSIAIYLFSLQGVSEWPIVLTAFTMWLFNYILPSLIGSYFVLKYQPQWK